MDPLIYDSFYTNATCPAFGANRNPDNCPLPILSRNASLSSGRVLYGPAIRLLTECRNGQVVYHDPYAPEIFPWGVCGHRETETFAMLLDRKRMLFRCTSKNPDREKFRIAVSRPHLFNGESYAGKNQRVTDGCDKHCARAGVPFDPNLPVANGKAKVQWSAPKFNRETNVLLWQASIQFPYGERPLFLAASASVLLTYSESASLWILMAEWKDSSAIETVFAAGNSEEEVLKKISDAASNFNALLRQKKNEITRLEKKAPSIEIEGMPAAGDFMRASVGYQHAMLLRDTTAIRAAQHKFGVFFLWDTLYPIRDLLWNGEIRQAKEVFRSVLGYPYLENSAWVVSQLVLVFDEILSFDTDRRFLSESWPWLERYLDFMLTQINPETGLIASSMTTGVDVPQELGLSGLYAAPCINAWWYSALRTLENLSMELGRESVREKVAPLIPRIEANYLKGFLSPRTGYLRSGVNEDLSHGTVEAFQNTSTIGFDYPFGEHLMRKAVNSLARFQSRRLYHPEGHTAVAWDSEIECEMWKSVHMNQHDGHEARLARLADDLPEAYRLIGCYLESFDFYKTAIETFNYSGCCGNESQTGDWQTFSSTAVCEALRSGLAGIARHRESLYYIPADDHRKIHLKNLRLKDTMVNVDISGTGPYFEPMKIDDRRQEGTAQIPSDRICGKSLQWSIRRSRHPFRTPVLLNSCGLPVRSIQVKGKTLTFLSAGCGHYPLEIAVPSEPEVRLNGAKIPFEFDPVKKRLRIDLQFRVDDRIEVIIL